MNNTPLVSVYVLTYKSSKTVLETLNSIYELSYPEIELLVSDDCSPDDTCDVVQAWISRHKSRFVRAELLTVPQNTGVAENQRRAIAACSADWIKGIAGDDALYPESITHLMEYVKNNPKARMIYGKSGRYDSLLSEDRLIEIHGSTEEPLNKVTTAQQQFDILLAWPCIDAPAVFYHKSVFQIKELQNCGYMGLEDYPLFLRYVSLGHKIYFCDELICKYRQSDTSIQRTSNFGNLITKCYLQHFFEETHNYYHGIDKIARYGVNIYDYVNCYCNNSLIRNCWRFGLYPLYWLFFRLRVHYDYKRINKALIKG